MDCSVSRTLCVTVTQHRVFVFRVTVFGQGHGQGFKIFKDHASFRCFVGFLS